MPGIDWYENKLKPLAHDRKIRNDILTIINQHNFTQFITSPTHVQGNTLDLICNNKPENIINTDVICPGFSDHFIVTTTVLYNLSRQERLKCVIKLYKQVDINRFQDDMLKVKLELTKMDNVDQMWQHFSSQLKQAVDQHVPTKAISARPDNEPVWFNRQ